jgi:hypothetical protein
VASKLLQKSCFISVEKQQSSVKVIKNEIILRNFIGSLRDCGRLRRQDRAEEKGKVCRGAMEGV